MGDLDILILGAGWTATFLIPLLHTKGLSFAATTRDGRKVAGADTLKWTFDPSSEEEEDNPTEKKKNQFSHLPSAKAVLITFPLTSASQSRTLAHGYASAQNKGVHDVHFIQLGSTGIWQIPQSSVWTSRRSPYDTSNKRAAAEDELLRCGGCVLNLAGLWGGARDPRDWVGRVAKTKEEVRAKKSVHLVHGEDVARGVVEVVRGEWEVSKGQRWMVTDGFVYDWWSLFAGWAGEGKGTEGGEERRPSEQARWVYDLMWEEGVLALPRSAEMLGRCYDSREFWATYELAPLRARV